MTTSTVFTWAAPDSLWESKPHGYGMAEGVFRGASGLTTTLVHSPHARTENDGNWWGGLKIWGALHG